MTQSDDRPGEQLQGFLGQLQGLLYLAVADRVALIRQDSRESVQSAFDALMRNFSQLHADLNALTSASELSDRGLVGPQLIFRLKRWRAFLLDISTRRFESAKTLVNALDEADEVLKAIAPVFHAAYGIVGFNNELRKELTLEVIHQEPEVVLAPPAAQASSEPEAWHEDEDSDAFDTETAS